MMNKKLVFTGVIAVLALCAIVLTARLKNGVTDAATKKSAHLEMEQKKPKVEIDARAQNTPLLPANRTKIWEDVSFSLVKSRAMSGDKESQLQLSKMYDYCFLYNLNPRAAIAQLTDMGAAQPKCAARVEKIKDALAARCSTVDDGKPLPAEAVTLWLEQSAKQGHLTALIRHAVLSKETDERKLLAYVEELRSHPRPDAVFEMGAMSRLLEPYWKDESTKRAFSSSGYAEYAWQIAACRAGLDCTASSLHTSAMVFQGGCSYDNYEQYILNEMVSTAGREELEKTITLIQKEFLSTKEL